MEKILFENGTKVADGYVEIDGIRHVVIPAAYEGETPLSAENLIQMQKNIETHKYDLVLGSDLADNSQITLPCYYKVGNDSLKVLFEGCLLTKGVEYLEIGDTNSISNKIRINSWGDKIDAGFRFIFIVQGSYEGGVS